MTRFTPGKIHLVVGLAGIAVIVMLLLLQNSGSEPDKDMDGPVFPRIYQNLVTYESRIDLQNADILLINISTGEIGDLSQGVGNQYRPDIDKDRVVWQDKRSGYWNIYLKNLTSGNLTDQETTPHISGDRIVYVTERNTS